MISAARRSARRWPLPLVLVAFLLLGGVLVAMLSPHPRVNSYLDPANSTSDGSHALFDILGERGYKVVGVYTPAAAVAAIRSAGRRRSAVTLVVTSPELLTGGQRRTLAGPGVNLFLVGPGRATLAALAPEIFVKGNQRSSYGHRVRPACGLESARLAGSADVAGYTYTIPANAVGCYPVHEYPSLVRYSAGGRTVTIVASGAPLSNAFLARDGNAALTLNLLSDQRTIVWLTPEPATRAAIPAPGPRPGRPGPSLLPAGVWLLLLQLCVAAALAAAWRARRFGPLIAERLPVVVRASETVEGHARLYQARRARGRAATALRDAMLGRIRPTLGLVGDAPQEAVTEALTRRSRLGRPEIEAVAYGPPPANDADLVRLARSLDELEREVRSQ